MMSLVVELKKQKRTGIMFIMLIVGLLGAAFVLFNFKLRKGVMLQSGLDPLDALFSYTYGVLGMLNLIAIVVTACMLYYIEYEGNAIKKMYMLPIDISKMYVNKFILLVIYLFVAIFIQYIAMIKVGVNSLPGDYSVKQLIVLMLYTYITSLPVASFMLFIVSRLQSIWVSLGIGVVGFILGNLTITHKSKLLWVIPFDTIFRACGNRSAEVNGTLVCISIVVTLLFLVLGMYISKKKNYE